jgi:ribosomal protein S18 acetylase RimI-like enzyme
MNIRFAERTDCPTLASLNQTVQHIHAEAVPQLFKSSPDRVQVIDFFVDLLDDPENRIMLLEDDGQAVGYLYFQILRRPENAFMFAYDVIYIHHIAVERSKQGRGYGTQLINAAVEFARNKRVPQIALDTWSFNSDAQEFFMRKGFKIFNIRMNRMLDF